MKDFFPDILSLRHLQVYNRMVQKPSETNLGFKCGLVQGFSSDDHHLPELTMLLWWINGALEAFHCVHLAKYRVEFGVP